MFSVGDRISHPMHGAGIVECIEAKRVNGVTRRYYVMKLAVGSMQVLVPTESTQAVGVRPILTQAAAERVLRLIPALETENDTNWNRRYRDNMVRIRSGDLVEVARVIKSLSRRDTGKGLSTGERRMLHSARQILVSELALSIGNTHEEIAARLDSALREVAAERNR